MSPSTTMISLRKNLKPTVKNLVADLMDLAYRQPQRFRLDLDRQEMRCVNELRRQGFSIVKDYWPREKALRMRDRLNAYQGKGENQDFDNGAYLRSWDHTSPYQGYQGVLRIYHVERLMQELRNFRNNAFIHRIAAGYYGIPFYSRVLMFQRNTQRDTANTGYYHVDSFGKEFKAFLYLDDVDDGNGPLTYLQGTHRSHMIRLKKQLFGNTDASPSRFYENDLRPVLDQEVKIYGPAGTLVLADVRGFHRAAPAVNRPRSVLVNYLYKTSTDIYFDK